MKTRYARMNEIARGASKVIQAIGNDEALILTHKGKPSYVLLSPARIANWENVRTVSEFQNAVYRIGRELTEDGVVTIFKNCSPYVTMIRYETYLNQFNN